jgi:hypothetical protein
MEIACPDKEFSVTELIFFYILFHYQLFQRSIFRRKKSMTKTLLFYSFYIRQLSCLGERKQLEERKTKTKRS